MTDDRAEQAFRTALATRATAFEPATLPPPDPARRRRWPALLAVAALLLAVVGAGLAVRAVRPDSAAPAGLPSGWRWESHANVMVAVPRSWGYAAAPGSDWCATTSDHNRARRAGPPAAGYVDTRTSGDAVLDIACGGTPPESLTAPHLSFSDDMGSEIPTPPGWERLSRTVGGTRITVTMDSARRSLAERILATAHVVREDQNGCTASSPLQDPLVGRPHPPFDVATLAGVDSIAVCQYQLDVKGPGLIASRLLTGESARAELAALQAASTHGGPNRSHQCSAADRGTSAITLLLRSGGTTHEMYATYEGCSNNGIDDGTHVRELTTADCRPLFTPRIRIMEGINSAFDRCGPTRPR